MSETTTPDDSVTREITIDAPPEDVWEAVSTEDGRERWLEPDADRRLVVERTLAPHQISWWWWNDSDDEPARYVDVQIIGVPDGGGTRVTVTETLPAMVPMAQLQASMEMVCA